jgi:membrane associated rhomboid family serine protease
MNCGYYSLGASGAISAVIFQIYIVLSAKPKWGCLMFIPVQYSCYLYLVFYTWYIAAYASKYSRDNINHDAHFFGAISGMAVTILLYPHIIQAFVHQFGL